MSLSDSISSKSSNVVGTRAMTMSSVSPSKRVRFNGGGNSSAFVAGDPLGAVSDSLVLSVEDSIYCSKTLIPWSSGTSSEDIGPALGGRARMDSLTDDADSKADSLPSAVRAVHVVQGQGMAGAGESLGIGRDWGEVDFAAWVADG